MTFHPLTQDSGSSAERRREEATDLVAKLTDYSEQLLPHERKFVEDMADEARECSTKQLFWLRNLWERFA